jgi:cytochrome c oxidase subunit 3
VSSDPVVARWRELTEDTALPAPRGASLAWWGMVMLVLTEGTLFAVLVASYFYLRWKTQSGWPPDGMPDPKLARPSVYTGVLMASGVTMAAAQVAARRGRQAALGWTLGLTVLAGLAFLGLLAWDLAEKTRDFVPQTNAYASLVYTLNGAHGAHAAVGVLLLGWITVRAWRGAYGPDRHVAVSVVGLYWQFVVVLAVVVYLTVVLSPYL